jgi:hypothetical protein
MAESQKAKANRLEKAREQRRIKREQTDDTPEATAERRNKKPEEYDAEKMKKRVGGSAGILLS